MKTLFKNATVLDGTREMKPSEGIDVLVDNGRIAAVGSCSAADAQIVDLSGKYLMPGLCNLHVHLPAGGRPGKQRDQKKLAQLVLKNPIVKQVAKSICASYAKDELFSGVTTLRAVGGLADIDTVLRDRINSGRQIGPRILAANMAIGPVGGHMVGTFKIHISRHHIEDILFCKIGRGTCLKRTWNIEMATFVFPCDDSHLPFR